MEILKVFPKNDVFNWAVMVSSEGEKPLQILHDHDSVVTMSLQRFDDKKQILGKNLSVFACEACKLYPVRTWCSTIFLDLTFKGLL